MQPRAAQTRPLHLPPGTATLLVLLAVVVGACHRNASVNPRPPAPPTASPVVRGAGTGLEVWSWVVSDKPPEPTPTPEAEQAAKPAPERQPFRVRRGTVLGPDGAPVAPQGVRLIDGRSALESLLAPYLSRPVPIATDLRERLRRAGFRIVAVPVADLEPLQQRMRLVGQMQRQWLGELPDWTEVARGPQLDEPRSVSLDDRPALIGPGRLFLAARCWATPVPGEGGAMLPAMRLELMPQLTPPAEPRERWRSAARSEPPRGPQRFESLAAALALTREEAYVIVADDPGADWEHPAAPSAPAPSAPGPVAPRPTTLGELMLSAPGAPGRGRTRAVVVLVPRIPDRFELLP